MIGAVEVAVIVGYGLAGIFFGLWVGERRARLFIENTAIYGRSGGIEPATIYSPEEPEDRVEKAADRISGERRQQVVDDEHTPPAYDPKTIENGIQFLLDEARSRGEQLSHEEAEEEAIRMLNAEGPEMA